MGLVCSESQNLCSTAVSVCVELGLQDGEKKVEALAVKCGPVGTVHKHGSEMSLE